MDIFEGGVAKTGTANSQKQHATDSIIHDKYDVPVVPDLDDETTTANVDASRISQGSNNILDNGGKFTKEGRVTIRERIVARQEDGEKKMLEISISDNGPGIPEDMFPVFFTKFSTRISAD